MRTVIGQHHIIMRGTLKKKKLKKKASRSIKKETEEKVQDNNMLSWGTPRRTKARYRSRRLVFGSQVWHERFTPVAGQVSVVTRASGTRQCQRRTD